MQETRTEVISITESKVFSVALLTTSFLIPFFVSGPQLLIGILVNMFLYLSIRFFGMKKTVPMLFLPSIAATLNGLVFGVFSQYLLFFLPFIWGSNYLMIYIYIIPIGRLCRKVRQFLCRQQGKRDFYLSLPLYL